MKPYSESCIQNREPILEILREVLATATHLLEIGSGTGQHSVYFAPKLTHLIWQTSELLENIPGILAWHHECPADNLPRPIFLDVEIGPWTAQKFDAIFSANTVHIMGWPQVVKLFAGIGMVLQNGGVFCLYGPFNYGGQYTSESNARFDQWLKQRDPASGIRDLDDLRKLGLLHGLMLEEDHAMPANNRILQWRKQGLPSTLL